MSDHVSTPWRAEETPHGCTVLDANGECVLTRSNSEIIVRAVNAHEDLMEAARWALSILSDIRNHEDWEMCAVAESVENLSAAIAKAEGGAS